jgi:DNA-binding transcriptional LysR family regulator
MPFSYTSARMELRHLRYFVTVAEELNVSRASARLRISQPAVSRQLRDLEEELHVQLFRREKSGLKLTPAGESFLAHARDLLRRSGDAVKHMEAFSTPAKQTLTIGYIEQKNHSACVSAGARLQIEHWKEGFLLLKKETARGEKAQRV